MSTRCKYFEHHFFTEKHMCTLLKKQINSQWIAEFNCDHAGDKCLELSTKLKKNCKLLNNSTSVCQCIKKKFAKSTIMKNAFSIIVPNVIGMLIILSFKSWR